MSKITPSPDLTYQNILPQLQKESQGLLPKGELATITSVEFTG